MTREQSQGHTPRAASDRSAHREHDPREPTATAPPSVPESVDEETEYAGKNGLDAADPPTAAKKSAPDEEPEADVDLDADERADLHVSRTTAREIKHARDEEEPG